MSKGPAGESKISHSCNQRRRRNHVRNFLDRGDLSAVAVPATAICADCFSELSHPWSHSGRQFDLASRLCRHPAEDLWRPVVLRGGSAFGRVVVTRANRSVTYRPLGALSRK